MPPATSTPASSAARRDSGRKLVVSEAIPWIALAAGLSLLCLLVVPFPLGFDPNAWVTWATSISRGDSIRFVIEPGWKPLPVLVMAPFATVSVSLAAAVWMFVVRFCAFLIPVLIFWLVRPAFGTRAAVISALSPIAIPLLWVGAADGHSEAVVAACALAAGGLIRSGRRRSAVALATALCLMRPEAILILAAFGLWFMHKRDWEGVALLLLAALVFATGWFVIPWIVSGDAFTTSSTSRRIPPFRTGLTPLQNLRMPMSEGIWPERLLIAPLVVAGLVALRQKRDIPIALLVGSAAMFTAIAVATLASGSAGDPRYFLIASISACCLAGPGAMLLINLIPSARAATAAFMALACLFLASSAFPHSPLSRGHFRIPGPDIAGSLDAGAQALRFALDSREKLNCPASKIVAEYVSWPQLAARVEHPMGDFNYIARAPAIAVGQSAGPATADRPNPYLVISGTSGPPRVEARFPAGDKTWTVSYYPGGARCRQPRSTAPHLGAAPAAPAR